MERIEIYNASLKDAVFAFTDACFQSVGKEFEPDGRHAREKGYRRIVLDSMSKYTSALKLYEKYGFTHIERYNGNQKADVFMEYRFTGRED